MAHDRLLPHVVLVGLAMSSLHAASADSVWTPLTVMSVADPMAHGAIGDGSANDLAALDATVSSLPVTGGIVYLPPGRTFRKAATWTIAKSHVKVWAPNRQAEVFADVSAGTDRQSLLFQNAQWSGIFGLKQRSNATSRASGLKDNQFTFDHCAGIEVCGTEIVGSNAVGLLLYGASSQAFIEGNFIHHTYADHLHHTDGSHHSWCWGNWFLNADPSKGDDGIAAVTYGAASPRCTDMEWWGNTHLGSTTGRGYSVIGGDRIAIHDNWAIDTAQAGIIVASESGWGGTSGSSDIRISRNRLYRCVNAVSSGHAGILLSGGATGTVITGVTLADNVVVQTQTGQAFRSEGAVTGTTNTGLSTDAVQLPSPIPTLASVAIADTTVLRTRDTSFVPAVSRPGLYRIHVKRASAATGFLQRFEYVVTSRPPPSPVGRPRAPRPAIICSTCARSAARLMPSSCRANR